MDVPQVWTAADRYMHTFYSLSDCDNNVFPLLSLLSFIITHLQRQKVTPNQEDVLESKVDGFEGLLKVCIHRMSVIPLHRNQNLPGAPVYRLKYDELKKRATAVRRPYHARTVALLDQNYVLFKQKDKHPDQLELYER